MWIEYIVFLWIVISIVVFYIQNRQFKRIARNFDFVVTQIEKLDVAMTNTQKSLPNVVSAVNNINKDIFSIKREMRTDKNKADKQLKEVKKSVYGKR